MAARCSFHSTTSVALSPVLSAVGQGYQIGLHPTPMHMVEHESSQNPSPIMKDLISMDFLSHLRVTEHPIELPPASAGHTQAGSYIASPLPLLKDTTANRVPPLPPSSPSSSHDHCTPRTYHGVERRQRSRPSSHGRTDYFSKLTRAERAAVKTASSRRVTFAEHAHQIASSSFWTAPDGALPAATKRKRFRPPTPSPIPAGRTVSLGFDDERDASPGFDADVEFEPSDVSFRDRHAHVGDKERLTIIVPGGKSEAYVAMAFERSCSLADDGHHHDDDSSAVNHDMSSSPSFIPPMSTEQLLLTPEGETTKEKGKEKTGLKIKIPVPNPLFMLSLRLASSCRVSNEAREDADAAPAEYPGGTDNSFPVSGYFFPTSAPPPLRGGSGSENTMMVIPQDRDHLLQDQVPFPFPVRVGGVGGDAASRSPTPPAAPPPSPTPEGRAARRAMRRAALAPYCAIDRLHFPRLSKQPCLLPY